jgi:glycosyltransferase involved in cell wall biosynthesis
MQISVVVLVRNQLESHKLALHSLLNISQCNEDWEVIVCDNGSNPKVQDSVEWSNYSSNIPITYLDCDESNYSLSSSRNAGISYAKAPIILCIDGDIVLPPGLVQKHLELQHERQRIIGGTRIWLQLGIDVKLETIDLHLSTAYKQILETSKSQCLLTQKRERFEIEMQYHCSTSELWRSCIGFQLSFPKSEHIFFCEEFIGWGFEDLDFILHQIEQAIYPTEFHPELMTYHIDMDSRAFNPFRTMNNNSDALEQLLKNIILVVERHPSTLNISTTMSCLDRLYYCSSRDVWKIGYEKNFDNRVKKYKDIKSWMLNRYVAKNY